MDRDRKSGEEAIKSYDNHWPGRGGGRGSSLKQVADICYRSPADLAQNHSVSGRKLLIRPCGPPAHAGVLAIRLCVKPLQRLIGALALWQWGLELLRANHYPHRSIGLPRASVLLPPGADSKTRVYDAKRRGSKDATGAKECDRSRAITGAVPQPASRLRSGGSNPVRLRRQGSCICSGDWPPRVQSWGSALLLP